MRKFTHLDALDQPRRRRSKAPLVLLFALDPRRHPAPVRGRQDEPVRLGLFGFAGRVDTPLLDFLSAQWEYSHSELRDWSTPLLANRRWNPRLVIPFAFFWTAAAALMLRRGH